MHGRRRRRRSSFIITCMKRTRSHGRFQGRDSMTLSPSRPLSLTPLSLPLTFSLTHSLSPTLSLSPSPSLPPSLCPTLPVSRALARSPIPRPLPLLLQAKRSRATLLCRCMALWRGAIIDRHRFLRTGGGGGVGGKGGGEDEKFNSRSGGSPQTGAGKHVLHDTFVHRTELSKRSPSSLIHVVAPGRHGKSARWKSVS